MKIFSPLEHFEINFFTYLYNFYYDLSLNSGTVYLLSVLFFLLFTYFSLTKSTLVRSRSQIFFENLYLVVLAIFKQQISSVRALRFFPLIFTLFLFISLLNFTSLFIYSVSLTGHIIITMALAFSLFIGLLIIGLLNYGVNFFNFFVPKGVPLVLLDFIIVIEVFSFIIRPFSLSIRLFANMLAGHTLMGIFAQFAAYIISNYFLIFFLPLILVFLVFLLEIAVSIIQAYIFVSLICIYLNDVINLH